MGQLSRVIGDALGGSPQAVRDFAERELFGPLGMHSVTLEFDSVGTLMGAHALFATPRDFARLLSARRPHRRHTHPARGLGRLLRSKVLG